MVAVSYYSTFGNRGKGVFGKGFSSEKAAGDLKVESTVFKLLCAVYAINCVECASK